MSKKKFSLKDYDFNKNDIKDDPINYDLCDFIAHKFRGLPWNGSASELSKQVIEFIDSCAEDKVPIAGLSIYVLYNILDSEELVDEHPLDVVQVLKFRPAVRHTIVSDIRNYIQLKVDAQNLIKTHLKDNVV
ncbi:hypothetical protein [Xenorhabdus stockiae]|uniref:hypothetical protein n=1 Tax=Xenorhabdus stockiae TaxID=351614 RepID=UPI0040633FA8